MKIWYFENTHRDESNDILYDTIYLCILVEKYGQSNIKILDFQMCQLAGRSKKETIKLKILNFEGVDRWNWKEKTNMCNYLIHTVHTILTQIKETIWRNF